MIDDNVKQEEILPPHIRIIGFIVSTILSVFSLAYIVGFTFRYFTVPPNDIGLDNLLLFTLASLIFFGVPWGQLGFSIKKLGPIEIERKLKGQSQEHLTNISLIEDRLQVLEDNLDSSTINDNSALYETDLSMSDEVLKFLKQYNRWSFSPLKMEKWWDERKEYKIFKDKPDALRRTLRKLVANNQVDTKISKRGNTLYIHKN